MTTTKFIAIRIINKRHFLCAAFKIFRNIQYNVYQSFCGKSLRHIYKIVYNTKKPLSSWGMKTGAMQFKQKCRLDFFISISYLNSTFGAVVAAASAAKGILGVAPAKPAMIFVGN